MANHAHAHAYAQGEVVNSNAETHQKPLVSASDAPRRLAGPRLDPCSNPPEANLKLQTCDPQLHLCRCRGRRLAPRQNQASRGQENPSLAWLVTSAMGRKAWKLGAYATFADALGDPLR